MKIPNMEKFENLKNVVTHVQWIIKIKQKWQWQWSKFKNSKKSKKRKSKRKSKILKSKHQKIQKFKNYDIFGCENSNI